MGCVCTVPFPTSLSLTFYYNSLISPSSPPPFLPFSFNQKFPPPKANPRCIWIHFFFFFLFCILPLDSHFSSWKCFFYPLPLHVCLNPCWLRPSPSPSLTHRVMSSLCDQGCSTKSEWGVGSRGQHFSAPQGPGWARK